MDGSSLLAGSWSTDAGGGDGEGKDQVDEDIQCTGCVNWGRAIDVSCGLAGALLLVYSSSCAVDPNADAYATGSCLPGARPGVPTYLRAPAALCNAGLCILLLHAGFWYVAIVVISALVFCRPLHQAAKEPQPPPGSRPVAFTLGRAVDITAGLVGTVGLAYGSSCGLALAVASREQERGLENACLPNQWWTVPMFLAIMLILRPLWSLISRTCPLHSLYRSCHKWRCCCGCSWVFPLLCLGSFTCLTYGHIAVNTTVFGVANGVRDVNGTDSSFWGGVRDNAANGQWFVLALAVFFNVIVLYVCLVIMVFCWFSPWRRGALVTVVCLLAKWCAFHQYSNIINGISLAFELVIPILAPNGIWLEVVAGLGVVYQTLGLLFTVSLVEVLLYTYAHTPRGVGANKLDDEETTDSWSFSGGRDSGRSRFSRRGSAAQIGYNNRTSNADETPSSLFKRVDDRKDRERIAAGWQAVASGESFGVSCDCSGKICAMLVQIAVPFCLVGFFICFYVATFSSASLEFDFVTNIECQIGGFVCPSIRPPPNNCAETILRNSGRTVGTGANQTFDFSACGDFTTSLADLYLGIWNSQLGYQHALVACPNGDDDCPQPGPPCNEGFCQPGPIILNTNRVFAFALTLGPIIVLPQLQMLLAAVVWFVPLKIRTMAHCILAMHMLLAWSTLDVWTVTLAVRMGDLERYSITAQAQTCQEFGADLDPGPPSVCFGAIGVLGMGFYWLIPACCALQLSRCTFVCHALQNALTLNSCATTVRFVCRCAVLQWIAAAYVSYEGAGVILQAAGEEDEEVRCLATSPGLQRPLQAID